MLNEGSNMKKSQKAMNQSLIRYVKLYCFFQQKVQKKVINKDRFAMDCVGEDIIDVDDNESYLLGYN
jgi:hypothetical protein